MSLKQKVNFNIIRYANCWEDADILLEGLSPDAGSRILSIGSAGDNSFALLRSSPEIVIAVDINKLQLHLIELKKVAIKKLDRDETLKFLGFSASLKRKDTFFEIQHEMSSEASSYWKNNLTTIDKGVIYSGKFESYLQLFSKKILPLIHSKKTIETLFEEKTVSAQEIFYNKSWNTWRWKLLLKVFFSKLIMGKYGRDPEFMKEVTVNVAKTIYNKAEAHLKSVNSQQNLLLHFCLKGNFGMHLPYYLKKENFEIIKLNIDKLILNEGYAHEAINKFGKFDAMNLSNIFEYMDKKTFETTSEAFVKGLTQNGKIAYWNLMVPRKISQSFPQLISYQKNLSQGLSAVDKGFFYNEFIIDKING